ncbi:unnamed protein product [Paramecium primaurelia]|uniref:Uncharacterized protein n=1 Tax=Paramecium primaurelia TaxID=5886 RepID=A0A8S1KWE3_PARPR|nr:unnamed protein product [Paramecium primaurelia]
MIIDFLGGTNSFDVKNDLVAFEQGNSLLLLDTTNNSKVQMHGHVNQIMAICFCGQNLIASVSMGFKNHLQISEFDTFNRTFDDYLPDTDKKTVNIFMENINNQLILIEVNTGHRILVYDIQQYKLLFITDLDNLNPCYGFSYLPTKPKTKICLMCNGQVTLWNLTSNNVQVTNRITLKNIKHMDTNKSLNLIILILVTGDLYILNSDGDLISQLKVPDQEFTASTSYEQYLYLSTRNGKIFIYEISTLKFVTEIHANDTCYCVQLKHSNQLLVFSLNDSNLITMDINKRIILDQQNGHGGRINQVSWDPIQSNQFYSCSNDGSFGVSNSRGDKFSMNKYYIGQFQTKIKCCAIDNYRDDIYLGDNKGQLFVFSLMNVQFRRQIALTQNLGIKEMQFSPAYQYLGVAFKNGFTIILDCENQLKPVLKLEDKLENISYVGIKLFQLEFDIVKVNTQAYSTSYIPRNDKSFNSLTIYNHNSVRRHQIDKANSQLSALALSIYTIEGTIFGFDLHPSKDYILILSNYGFVYIYKIQSSEKRAKISVPPFSRHLKIDKSGLYFAIAHLPLVNTSEKQFIEIPSIEFLTKNAKINKKMLPTNIRIYECGTGQVAEQINRIFSIVSLDFSNDGQYLLVGGKKGKISLWGLSQDLVQSAEDVIKDMKINPFFWRDFQIYIDDEEILEQDILDLELLAKKLPNKPIVQSQKYQQIVNPHTILQTPGSASSRYELY